MSISYADMREIVAIEHKGESHKEGEDLDQFIDCMTKIRMEQHTKIEDKVEALLNQLVFPDEMIVKMSKVLSPKKKKIKFNIKKVEKKESYEEWSRRTGKDKEWTSLEKEFYNKEEEEYCDDCEGPCRADETEECEDCKIKLRIGCANNPSNHSIFDGCCDDCREEEEEEEELDICGETGREFDEGNPLKGCGKKITEDDENLMIGNISYCLSCVENSEEEVISEWHEAQGR